MLKIGRVRAGRDGRTMPVGLMSLALPCALIRLDPPSAYCSLSHHSSRFLEPSR